ncbi:MAG: hypothetical protein R2758_05980 [Bacteroidales bacterium]
MQTTHLPTLIASPPSWNPYPIYRKTEPPGYTGGGRDPYPLYLLQSTGNNITRERFVGSLSIEYKIAEHLNFRSVTGVSTNSRFHRNAWQKNMRPWRLQECSTGTTTAASRC